VDGGRKTKSKVEVGPAHAHDEAEAAQQSRQVPIERQRYRCGFLIANQTQNSRDGACEKAHKGMRTNFTWIVWVKRGGEMGA